MVKYIKESDSRDSIQSIIRQANTIQLPKCFDEETWNVLEQTG